MITSKEYFMGRDITCSSELTDEIKDNAELLIKTVNLFLAEIGITEASVSSGWRPSSINSKVPNAAKKSLHMSGLAIDLADDKGLIKAAVLNNMHVLKKYNMWLENPNNTKSWCHLDLGTRSKRAYNMFTP